MRIGARGALRRNWRGDLLEAVELGGRFVSGPLVSGLDEEGTTYALSGGIGGGREHVTLAPPGGSRSQASVSSCGGTSIP